MKVLKKTRKRPLRGDVFVFQLDDGRVLYGRVVRDDVECLGVRCFLIYIHDIILDTTEHQPEEFDTSSLLLPPMLVPQQMWTRGFFKNVESQSMAAKHELRQHCFDEQKHSGPDSYVDEYGKHLAKRSEPCGPAGIFTDLGVEAEVLKALS